MLKINKKISILSRASALAQIQARLVGDSLISEHPGLKINYNTSKSIADKDPYMDIANSNSVGVFTTDISNSIIKGENDIAVHSWKDLPVEISTDTEVISTLARGDMRDIMIVKKETALSKKRNILKVLTSSPRRKHNLNKVLPGLFPVEYSSLIFEEVRGNIETRLNKFIDGDGDIILIAKVALDRIIKYGDEKISRKVKDILQNTKWIILPLSIFPTAPGQGAIAVEARKDNLMLKKMFEKINDVDAFSDVISEKRILSKYGGGCSQKIGLSIWSAREIKLHSIVGQTEEGESLERMGHFGNENNEANYKTETRLLYPNNIDRKTFNRVALHNKELNKIKNSFVFISRKSVLDYCEKLDSSNIFWTSGLKCWNYAVEKGYWVNGSSDNMGERTGIDIENILSKGLKKYKLSHNSASSDIFQIMPTYQLVFNKEKMQDLDLDSKEEFYWMSPLQFDIALELFPSIIDKNHSCGFGRTYDHLKRILPKSSKISCYFSYEKWIEFHRIEKSFQNE